MDSITIFPKDEKQKSLLKSLLEEMKVRFEVGHSTDKILLTESEFYEKIDRSIAQAERGDRKTITKEEQRELLGL